MKCAQIHFYLPKSPPNPESQGLTVQGLPRRPGVQKHPRRDLQVPKPPRPRWTSSARPPWRTSTTFPTMQWTAWSTEASGGRSRVKPRRKRRREPNRRRKSRSLKFAKTSNSFSLLLARIQAP